MNSDADGFVSLALLFLLALFLWGVSNNWQFDGSRLYLEIECEKGDSLNPDRTCDGPWHAMRTLRTRVNAESRTAMVYQVIPAGAVEPTVLRDCAIIDIDNWSCQLPKWGATDDPVNEEVGVDRGRYFSRMFSALPPNFSQSSIHGFWLGLYRMHWLELSRAGELEGQKGTLSPS